MNGRAPGFSVCPYPGDLLAPTSQAEKAVLTILGLTVAPGRPVLPLPVPMRRGQSLGSRRLERHDGRDAAMPPRCERLPTSATEAFLHHRAGFFRARPRFLAAAWTAAQKRANVFY